MKATQQRFLAAIAPVLADVERTHPGLLRLALQPALVSGVDGDYRRDHDPQTVDEEVDEDADADYMQAMLWLRDGGGAGLFLGDGNERLADDIEELSDYVQDLMIDEVHGAWPECPRHPGGSPLEVWATDADVAVWGCPETNEALWAVGELGLDPS